MRAPAGASSVGPVVPVTENFTSEAPMHPAAREALLAAFDQGWANPKKLSQSSARAGILRNQAIENIATRLGLRPDGIEILGEPSLGPYLAIAGILDPKKLLAYASIDRGKIKAVARAHTGATLEIPVTSSGSLLPPDAIEEGAVLSLQLANAETGIIQDYQSLASKFSKVAIDATTSGPRLALPEHWTTALFDSLSWSGPSGLAILALKNSSEFSYPLPRIAPIKSPGSYSLPLLIASSIALENFQIEDAALRQYASEQITAVASCTVVAPEANALPHLLSVVISGVSGEYLVREMAIQGVDIDSGSACSPADLQPSHVLAAMGYPTEGHLRITLHKETSRMNIDHLVSTLEAVAMNLRR